MISAAARAIIDAIIEQSADGVGRGRARPQWVLSLAVDARELTAAARSVSGRGPAPSSEAAAPSPPALNSDPPTAAPPGQPLLSAPEPVVSELVEDALAVTPLGTGARRAPWRARERWSGVSGGLRRHAGRGTLINSVFLVGLSLLGFLRGFILATLLSPRDYGLWGILVITLGTLAWLKQGGIGDKYIQQDEPDQELAFQKAFTLEAMLTGALMAVMIAAIPIIALVYGRTDLVAPAAVIVLSLPAGVLQTPLWVFYRRMRFLRQRAVQAIDPLVAFVVSIGLGLAGAGYWALVVGYLSGVWASALVSVATSPYPLRFRYERGTLRLYAGFSWPLMVAGGCALIIAQSSIFLTTAQLGLAGAGALTLAATVSQLSDRVDGIISGTLYPAICSVRDRTDLLYEAFVKSNRLALMWAVPFGVGVAVFGGDLIAFVIGEKWRAAQPVLVVFGLTAAAGHLGFNWDSYFRARGQTRPVAVAALANLGGFLAAAIPLLYLDGLSGLALGVGVATALSLLCRGYYLAHLFQGFHMFRHALRAMAPTVPAVGVVLVTRGLEPGPRTFGLAVAEVALYVGLTLLGTIAFERPLLREVLGYVRRAPASTSAQS